MANQQTRPQSRGLLPDQQGGPFARQSVTDYLHSLVRKEGDCQACPDAILSNSPGGAVLRTKYVDWFFNENKKMGFDTNTAAIAINILERYMSSKKLSKAEILMGLYGSLSLAARTHEGVRVSFSKGTKGMFTQTDIEMTEAAILQSISWRVHPVTPHCIARNVMILLPPCSDDAMQLRHEDVDTLLEISIGGHELRGDAPSTIAFAAILATNAFYNLTNERVWNIAREIVPDLDVARIVACSEAMEQLLGFFGDETAEEEGYISPTGVDCPDSNYSTSRAKRNQIMANAKSSPKRKRTAPPLQQPALKKSAHDTYDHGSRV